MKQQRGTDGRWKGKRTVYVPVRMNALDMARINELISAGIGETPSDIIRYALHNCSNDDKLSSTP